jgi:hypothetical protein
MMDVGGNQATFIVRGDLVSKLAIGRSLILYNIELYKGTNWLISSKYDSLIAIDYKHTFEHWNPTIPLAAPTILLSNLYRYIGSNESDEIHYEFRERRYWILNECSIFPLDSAITTLVCEKCLTVRVHSPICDVCREEKKYPYLIMRFQIIQKGTKLIARITNQYMLKKILAEVMSLNDIEAFNDGNFESYERFVSSPKLIDFTKYTTLAATCSIIDGLYCNFEIVKFF